MLVIKTMRGRVCLAVCLCFNYEPSYRIAILFNIKQQSAYESLCPTLFQEDDDDVEAIPQPKQRKGWRQLAAMSLGRERVSVGRMKMKLHKWS
jgi:hypothetical protein